MRFVFIRGLRDISAICRPRAILDITVCENNIYHADVVKLIPEYLAAA